MDKRQKSRLKKIGGIFFSFVISLTTTLFLLCALLKCTVYNPQYMLDQMNKSRFYTAVFEDIRDRFVSLGAASGFDEAFFDTVLTQKQIEADCAAVIASGYENGSATWDDQSFTQRINEQFLSHILSEGGTLTDEIKANVMELAKVCASNYETIITPPFFNTLMGVLNQSDRFITVGLIASLIISLSCCIVIWCFTRWKHRAVRYMIYGFSGSFLMLAVMPTAVYFSGMIDRLSISTQSLYVFATAYFKQILQLNLLIAVVFFIIILAAGLPAYYLIRKKYT